MQCLFLHMALPAQIFFEDVGFSIGLRYGNSVANIGNGISFVDFNQDGWDDLTIGTNAGKFIDFYLNDQGTFRRILPLVDHKDEAKQILWVDYDNDHDLDLFVATFQGVNRLYQNQGDLRLVDVTQKVGLPTDTEYTFGAIWGDYDRDGWLDLYFGNHKDVRPDKYNKLFRSNRDGTFTDVSTYSRTADLNKVPYCSAFLDFNNDMWPDIYTANDKLTYNTLLMNQGNGRFYDASELSNSGLRMNAMCVNVGDYNNDGWQDIYITNTPIGNRLIKNTGLAKFGDVVEFEEVAEEAGVAYYGHGWASNFLDADNDGDLDLYVNGSAKIKSAGNRSSLFYENMGDGQFSIPEVGMSGDSARSYANAIGDINNDGFPDIAVQNNPPDYHFLWKNKKTNPNNWLKIKLVGTQSNREAIGAKIEAYAGELYQMRYLHCGIGFLGQNSKKEMLGLADHTVIDSLIITWPSGVKDKFLDVKVNHLKTIYEGSSDGKQDQEKINTEILKDLLLYEKNKNNSFSIYPNPAKDVIQLKRPFVFSESSSLTIYNAQGQIVRQTAFQDQMDISALEKGLYWIVLEGDKQQMGIQQFIKQ